MIGVIRSKIRFILGITELLFLFTLWMVWSIVDLTSRSVREQVSSWLIISLVLVSGIVFSSMGYFTFTYWRMFKNILNQIRYGEEVSKEGVMVQVNSPDANRIEKMLSMNGLSVSRDTESISQADQCLLHISLNSAMGRRDGGQNCG